MRNGTMHPTDERLEAYCDGSLGHQDQSVLESHLFQCGRCRSEVEDWRSLFSALAAMPALAPTAGFADRVMAHVRVSQPWYARAEAWASRFVPRTTGGWVMAVLLLAVPIIAAGTLAVWLLSRSYLTGYRLWVFATDQFAAGTNHVAQGALTRLLETDVAVWLVTSATAFMETAGVRGVSVAAGAAAAVIMISVWVLYRNLFRTPTRGSNYVSFTF